MRLSYLVGLDRPLSYFKTVYFFTLRNFCTVHFDILRRSIFTLKNSCVVHFYPSIYPDRPLLVKLPSTSAHYRLFRATVQFKDRHFPPIGSSILDLTRFNDQSMKNINTKNRADTDADTDIHIFPEADTDTDIHYFTTADTDADTDNHFFFSRRHRRRHRHRKK